MMVKSLTSLLANILMEPTAVGRSGLGLSNFSGRPESLFASTLLTRSTIFEQRKGLSGLLGRTVNFNQKAYPVNPISYLKKHGISAVFRFILTHPDMDHMDGIKDFFEEFEPINFWDIHNNKK